MNKHTIFLALLILSAIIVRIIWSFWGASEYWGDGYHNIWIIQQTIEFGEYFDYKDRHLVWLLPTAIIVARTCGFGSRIEQQFLGTIPITTLVCRYLASIS